MGRTWPGVVVADVDDNGDLEIVTAHGGGYVSVYDHQGYFEPGWPQRPTTSELRGLSVYDLDGDHGLTGSYCVESLDYALESVGTAASSACPVAAEEMTTIFPDSSSRTSSGTSSRSFSLRLGKITVRSPAR